MLAVACDPPVLAAGDTYRADALLRRVPARAWQGVSAGQGAKGHRYDDWAFLRLDDGDPFPGGPAGQRWLLVRRNRTTRELSFYRCWTPRPVLLATLVRVAGRRWRIEEGPSRPARAWSAGTSIRSAAGAPGTGGPPWPCSPTPSWWCLRPPPAPATHHRPD